MRRTSLWILALALAAGACSSESSKPVDPARLGVQIVSGDRQVAPVAVAAGASQSLAGLSAQQLPDNLLPEPLVARITVDGAPLKSIAAPVDPLSPSFTTLPSDVVVTYRVIQPTGVGQRHCGASFVDAATPDKDGLVTTYWERGTYAGECRMEVRLVVDGAPRVDTAFVVGFESGEIVRFASPGDGNSGFAPLGIGERLWADAHWNPGAWRAEVDTVFRVLGTQYGTTAARTIEPIDTAIGAGGEAVVCIKTAGGVIAVGRASYSVPLDGSAARVEFVVLSHPDPASVCATGT
jgi:hypothetical protein